MDTLKRAWALLDPQQRRWLRGLSILSACNALLEVVGAGIIFALVNTLTREAEDPISSALRDLFPAWTDRQVTYALCVIAAVFYLVKNVAGVLEVHLRNSRVNEGATQSSMRLLGAYLRAPLTFHQERASGDLIRTTWWSTDQLWRGALVGGAQLVSEMLAAVMLVAVLIVAAPLITPLVLLTIGGVLFVAYRTFKHRLSTWGGEVQRQYGTCFRVLQETFGGIREIKLLEREQHFLDRYERDRRVLARAWRLSDTASQSSRFLLETTFVLSMVLLIVALMVTSDDLSGVTPLLALYGYVGFRLMPSANRALQALGALTAAGAAVSLVEQDRELLRGTTPERPAGAAPELGPLRHGVRLDGLVFRYPGAAAPALRGISMDIPAGTSVGIVGSSGAGKSTLVDVLVGLLDPDEGSVLADGVDVRHALSGWHGMLGYVSQSTFLLDATLRENIAFGVEPDAVDPARLEEALRLAQLGPFVASLDLGLDTHVGEDGVRLSGGQRQRIAIARALYRRPDVLVFDEATSALDNATEAELTAAIESLTGERTIVMIAHRLSTVRRCDRIYLLHDGQVLDVGTFDELVERNPEFRRLSGVLATDATGR